MLAIHLLPMRVQGPGEGAAPPDVPEVAATRFGLVIRLFQAIIAVTVLAFMCLPASYPKDPEFRWLVLASLVQVIWSMSLCLVDIYAAVVTRSLRNRWLLLAYTIGDGIISCLICLTAWDGIVILIAVDLRVCSQNHCSTYTWATVMGFVNSIAALPCFLLNLWWFLRVHGAVAAA